MGKFKDGDRVRFIKNYHKDNYVRAYCPAYGEEGVVRHYALNQNAYEVLFDGAEFWTYCYENEIEPVKPKETVVFIDNPNGLEVKCQDITIVDRYETQLNCYNKIFNKEEYDRYVKGEWKNMENKVLELWYTRNHNSIIDEYDKKEMEFNESKELVIKYKEIIENFEKELEELYNCEENIEKNYIKDNNLSESMYKYKINYDKLNDEFLENYVAERDEKLHELNELRKEINAQLSLSSELDYQIEVLTTYGILDKKTKKMVD